MLSYFLILSALCSSVSQAAKLVNVTGYVVDHWCWYTRNRITLDTFEDLSVDPTRHTVHCLIDVGVCFRSGYSFVHKPPGASRWEIHYELDETLNKQLRAELNKIPTANRNRYNIFGYQWTTQGVVDNDPNLRAPLLRAPDDTPSEPTAAPTTPAPTIAVPKLCSAPSVSDKVRSTLGAGRVLELEVSIDCATSKVQLSLNYTGFAEQWIGIVFSTKMPGHSLIYTLADGGKGAMDTLSLYPYINVGYSPPKLNEDDKWTVQSHSANNGVLSVRASADLDKTSIFVKEFGIVPVLVATGSTKQNYAISYHANNRTGKKQVMMLDLSGSAVKITGLVACKACWFNASATNCLQTANPLEDDPRQYSADDLLSICSDKGFVLVGKAASATKYSLLYVLDDVLSEALVWELSVWPEVNRTKIKGFEHTVTAIPDTDGATGKPLLRDVSTFPVRQFVAPASPTTTSPSSDGSTGCDAGNLVESKTEIGDYTVTINLDCSSNKVKVTIQYSSFEDNWFGVVFSKDMIGHALIYTTGKAGSDQASLYPYENTAKAESAVNPSTGDKWTIISDTTEGGTKTVVAEAKLEDTAIFSRGSEEISMLTAWGTSLQLMYHRMSRTREVVVLNLRTGGSVSIAPDLSLQITHGALMYVSWAWFASFGIMSSSFRWLLPTGPIWFYAHRTAQCLVVLLTLIGFIFAVVFTEESGSPHFNTPHKIMGLIVTIVAVLQPLNALVRPHPPADGWPNGKVPLARVIWSRGHKSLGYGAWVLGLAAIFFGLSLLDEHSRALRVPYIVSVVVLAILFISLAVFGYLKKGHLLSVKLAPKTDTETPDEGTEMMPDGKTDTGMETR